MKKILSKASKLAIATLLMLGCVFALPNAVWAANFSESFEYTAGNDITGTSGGSGFTGNWLLTAGHTTMVDRTGGQSGNSADGGTANADFGNDRNLTATIANGHGTCYLKNVTNASSGHSVIDFQDTSGGTSRFLVRARRSGLDSKVHLVALTTDSTTFGTWTDNTWQTIDLEWGTDGTLSGSAPGTNKVKGRFNGGSWTAALDFANNGAIGNFRIAYEGADGTVSTAGVDECTFVDADAAAGGGTSANVQPYQIDLFSNYF